MSGVMANPAPFRWALLPPAERSDPAQWEIDTERLTVRSYPRHCAGLEFMASLRGEHFIIASVQLRFEPGAEEACKGTWVHDRWQRQGIATEVNRAVLRYAFEELKLRRVFSNPSSGNTRSIKLQQRLGLRYQGKIGDLEIYAITAGEWWANHFRERNKP